MKSQIACYRKSTLLFLTSVCFPKYLHGVHHCFVPLALPVFFQSRAPGVSKLCPKQPRWQQGSGEEAVKSRGQ